MKLISIGFGNVVVAARLVAVVSPDSSPIKRIIQDARDKGTLIDATYGRRTRAVIITDSDHIILSAVQAETIANRIRSNREDDEDDILEDEDGEYRRFACPVGAVGRRKRHGPCRGLKEIFSRRPFLFGIGYDKRRETG